MEAESLFKIPFEKYQLTNGLQVILHQDDANPVVAVCILYHVGSARETPGKTGFAHFFEHMLFQNSEHVGRGNFFKMIEESGGTLNGGTWQDGTIYYEVVPKNILEQVLWMESDRMGYMINTVTWDVLENEKDVVKNEKRQRVDNQPYGHTHDMIHRNLYPEDHPYHWQVIGSMRDLNEATLEDVQTFHQTYYGPNNATLVIAGDFESQQVKSWVQHYFSDIPASAPVADLSIPPVHLLQDHRVYYLDPLANLPELNLVYPTVPETHPDYYPLAFLGSLLASGRRAPLFKTVVERDRLAPRVIAGNHSQELAGHFRIKVRANANVKLDKVEHSIRQGLTMFRDEKIDPRDIARIKNAQEIDFYNNISSVLNKSFQLAQFNVFRGDPAKLEYEIESILKVTESDIKAVFERYIWNQPSVATSVVPNDQSELALSGSRAANIEIDDPSLSGIPQDRWLELAPHINHSSFDRFVKPQPGEEFPINIPKVWKGKLANGLTIHCIEDHRLPLIEFSVRIKGGMLMDSPNRLGVANLISDMLMEGTAHKTPQQLLDAIHHLGSQIQVYTTAEYIELHASCLQRNFQATLDLAWEILLEPRWDEKEFTRILSKTISDIQLQRSKPSYLAGLTFKQVGYGVNHPLAKPTMGIPADLQQLSCADLIAYYERAFDPKLAAFQIAGAIRPEAVEKALAQARQTWPAQNAVLPSLQPIEPDSNAAYIVNIPNAQQTVLQVGWTGLTANHPDLPLIKFANYRLGGSFNSILNTQLREERGYTYGAQSFYSRRMQQGFFLISTQVHAKFSAESMQIIQQCLEQYGDQFTESDVEVTRQIINKSMARAFEGLYQKLGMLHTIFTYDLPVNYVQNNLARYEELTLPQVKAIIAKYFDFSKMKVVAAGDNDLLTNQLSTYQPILWAI